MKLHKFWTVVLAGALGLLASACAQTLPRPYQRAGTYPAELQLMHRLIEIAEGSPPTLAALEMEFGLSYQKNWNFTDEVQGYGATGSLLFIPIDSSSYTILPSRASGSIQLVRFSFAEQGVLNKANRPLCLSQIDIASQLTKRNWRLKKTIDPLHSVRDETFHRTSDGFVRRVFFSPIWSDCVKDFNIRYADIVKPQSPELQHQE